MVLLVATQNKTLLDNVARNCWNFLSLQATSGIDNETLTAMVRTLLLMSLTSSKMDDTPTFNGTRNRVPSYLLGKGEITTFFILPSLMIIILFSILTKRNHDKKACGVFGRRPGLCIPINLVDGYENRIGYACAFGVTASKCLDILLFGDYHTVFEGSMHIFQMDNQGKATWTTVLWNLMAMLIIGLAYYPMFLCLSTDYKLLGGIIGFVYTGFWLLTSSAYIILHYSNPIYLEWIFPILPYELYFLMDLPERICLLLLVIAYLVIIIKGLFRFFRRFRASEQDFQEQLWKNSYQYKCTLRLLLKIPKGHYKKGIIDAVKSKLYKSRHEFKYSTRVICTYAISLVVVFEVGIRLVILGLPKNHYLLFYLYPIISKITTAMLVFGWNPMLAKWTLIMRVSWFTAIAISTVYYIIATISMMSLHRSHLRRLQRGDKSLLPKKIQKESPSFMTVATLKYSGYQVAYITWGFLAMHFLLFAVCTLIGIEIIEPVTRGKLDSFLYTMIQNIWPTILFSFLLFLSQYLMAKFVFLHDKGATLTLNNRRLFHICTYFLFFFNIFLGVVSLLKRIIVCIAIGIMFLGRLQKSLVPRDYELYDPGYEAYLGYLYLEHTHSNPALVTFCRILLVVVNRKTKLSRSPEHFELLEVEGHPRVSFSFLYQEHRSKRIRNRWALLMTLINNPALALDRRAEKFVSQLPLQAVVNVANAYTEITAELLKRKEVKRRHEKDTHYVEEVVL